MDRRFTGKMSPDPEFADPMRNNPPNRSFLTFPSIYWDSYIAWNISRYCFRALLLIISSFEDCWRGRDAMIRPLGYPGLEYLELMGPGEWQAGSARSFSHALREPRLCGESATRMA